MKHYNCRNNPSQWDKIAEAVNKWAKAKGIDPEHVFTTNDWDVPKYSEYRCRPPLSKVVQGQINTSVFEEAEIEE